MMAAKTLLGIVQTPSLSCQQRRTACQRDHLSSGETAWSRTCQHPPDTRQTYFYDMTYQTTLKALQERKSYPDSVGASGRL